MGGGAAAGSGRVGGGEGDAAVGAAGEGGAGRGGSGGGFGGMCVHVYMFVWVGVWGLMDEQMMRGVYMC